MAAYLISDVTVHDHDAFETYRTRAAASIEAFGGRYLVRGGEISVLEGERHPSTLIVVEFPDIATAKRWYASPAYPAALDMRDQALSRSLILVDGVNVSAPKPPTRHERQRVPDTKTGSGCAKPPNLKAEHPDCRLVSRA